MIKIYPLSLRGKITNRLKKFISLGGENVRLHFNSKIKMNVEKQDTGHQSIIYNGYYELALSGKIVQLAKAGEVLFDVGANYGYFSLLWAAAASKNKVYAFEPSPGNFKALYKNVKLNNLVAQINCYDIALSNTNGQMRFQLNNNNGQTGWGGLTKENDAKDIAVQAMTLDNFCRQNRIDRIDALKIDTEGADPLVLEGAEKMISQKLITHIFFEINSRMKDLGINDFGYPIKFLKDRGYEVLKSGSTYYAF